MSTHPMATVPRYLNEDDFYLFQEGTHSRLPDVMGAHFIPERGGTQFAVWAPRARSVSVIGNFNDWQVNAAHMQRSPAGIWQCFVPGAFTGAHYKFRVENASNYHADKSDPFGFFFEASPATASIIWDLNYEWGDNEWMASRASPNSLHSPISIYEVHLGSWRRVPEEGNRSLTYREAADYLIPYVKEMGFTHLELLPIMEHPFYGSWGYQTTGYFAPTSRYGTPQDFMRLIDLFHQNGIGVILDWVPSHFPQDEYGLGYFDGEHEYEPADPRRGIQPDWNSFIFDYSRPEVRSFLISSAMFWLDRYHVDGLRVDAVASMLYLDYSRKPGQWIPNRKGRPRNSGCHRVPATLEPGSLSCSSRHANHRRRIHGVADGLAPLLGGGLGFGMKWDMGWMHDTLQYFSVDPIYRKLSSWRTDIPFWSTHSARTLFCRSRTMKSFTAKVRSSTKCPATSGKNLPVSACFFLTCTRCRVKSFCSWAANSASGANGVMIPVWIGICFSWKATERSAY